MIKAAMVLATIIVVGGLAAWAGRLQQEWPYNYQYTEIVNAPKPGEDVFIKVEVDRTKACANRFYREFYDGRKVRFGQHQWEQGAKPEGKDEYFIRLPIPETAAPGDARYCFAQEPECNWVQYALPNWTRMKCYPFTIAEAGR